MCLSLQRCHVSNNSTATQPLIQQPAKASHKESKMYYITSSLYGLSTSDWWPPLTSDQWCATHFYMIMQCFVMVQLPFLLPLYQQSGHSPATDSKIGKYRRNIKQSNISTLNYSTMYYWMLQRCCYFYTNTTYTFLCSISEGILYCTYFMPILSLPEAINIMSQHSILNVLIESYLNDIVPCSIIFVWKQELLHSKCGTSTYCLWLLQYTFPECLLFHTLTFAFQVTTV